jgi:hypothetical protein
MKLKAGTYGGISKQYYKLTKLVNMQILSTFKIIYDYLGK